MINKKYFEKFTEEELKIKYEFYVKVSNIDVYVYQGKIKYFNDKEVTVLVGCKMLKFKYDNIIKVCNIFY